MVSSNRNHALLNLVATEMVHRGNQHPLSNYSVARDTVSRDDTSTITVGFPNP